MPTLCPRPLSSLCVCLFSLSFLFLFFFFFGFFLFLATGWSKTAARKRGRRAHPPCDAQRGGRGGERRTQRVAEPMRNASACAMAAAMDAGALVSSPQQPRAPLCAASQSQPCSSPPAALHCVCTAHAVDRCDRIKPGCARTRVNKCGNDGDTGQRAGCRAHSHCAALHCTAAPRTAAHAPLSLRSVLDKTVPHSPTLIAARRPAAFVSASTAAPRAPRALPLPSPWARLRRRPRSSKSTIWAASSQRESTIRRRNRSEVRGNKIPQAS